MQLQPGVETQQSGSLYVNILFFLRYFVLLYFVVAVFLTSGQVEQLKLALEDNSGIYSCFSC